MTGRAVWRRATGSNPAPSEDERLRCGGPEMSVEQRYQLMRERRLARKRAPEDEPPAKAQSDDDDDELKAAERFRNDRYAVKLLKQDDEAWGGSAGGTGVLG